jgi:hypothetical protein
MYPLAVHSTSRRDIHSIPRRQILPSASEKGESSNKPFISLILAFHFILIKTNFYFGLLKLKCVNQNVNLNLSKQLCSTHKTSFREFHKLI